jgi:hypothetical protein
MTELLSRLVDGHILVILNNNEYLIDTGSPFSFGQGESITINDVHFPIAPTWNRLTVESINEISGLNINGLIGMNILQHFDIRITDVSITFSDHVLTCSDAAIRLPIVETVMAIPIINLQIANKIRRVYFDTGARLSYLNDDILLAYTPTGEMKDFHPSLGRFSTNTYQVDVTIGKHEQMHTFGSLPSQLRCMLDMSEVKGIVGTELLKNYTIILSNLSNNLILEPRFKHE